MIAFVDKLQQSGKISPSQGQVGVVGGGISGLVTAYELAKQGVQVTVFDSSNRSGGKIRTSGNEVAGRRFEYGAEFVDSDDHTIRRLCQELGVPLVPTADVDGTGRVKSGDMLYDIDGHKYTGDQVAEWFKPVSAGMQQLKDSLRDKDGNWTDTARKLDNMSLEDFLQQMQGSGADPRLISVLRQSYISEVGNHSSNLSALNFVDCVNTDVTKFEPFGVSDEEFKIAGGTQALTDALRKKCEDELGVKFEDRHPVRSVDRAGDKAVVHTEQGKTEVFDHLVVATSLPTMKHIDGLEKLGATPEQLGWMNSMQHINAVKIGLFTKGDAWKDCPIPSDGSFISDGAYQCAWAVSSNAEQLSSPSAPKQHGMVMMLVGGVQEDADVPSLIEQCKKDYAKTIGKPVNEIFDNDVAPEITISRSGKNGCYVSPAPGQYIPLCTACKQQPEGPLSIVGSHVPVQTAIGNKLGFMECGASSAHEQALAIAQKLRHEKGSRIETAMTPPREPNAALDRMLRGTLTQLTTASTAPAALPPGFTPQGGGWNRG